MKISVGKIISILLFCWALVYLNGCSFLARLFKSDEVADGVGRLSALSFSMLANQIIEDTECGYQSPKVRPHFRVENEKNGKGKVIWEIDSCRIHFSSEKLASSDCVGNQIYVKGGANLKSTMEIYGRLTGNPASPVIPDQGGVKIHIEGDLDEWQVRSQKALGHLKLDRGHLSFDLYPRFAKCQDGDASGLCVAKTSNAALKKIVLAHAAGTLFSKRADVDVYINKSDFGLQIGKGEQEENAIQGELEIWGRKKQLPSDGKGLDPNYDTSVFEKSYSCRNDLKGIVDYACAPVEKRLAQGGAALLSMAVGDVAYEYEKNKKCGFSNPANLRATQITGKPGDYNGLVRLQVHDTCKIEFHNEVLSTDCLGMERTYSGTAIIEAAEKSVSGLVVADGASFNNALSKYEKERNWPRPEAIIPANARGAQIALRVSFENLSVTERCTPTNAMENAYHCTKEERFKNAPESLAFVIKSGTVSARIDPVMGFDQDRNSSRYGTCSYRIPVGEMSLEGNNLQVSLKRGGNVFNYSIDRAEYGILSGEIDGKANRFFGNVLIDKQDFGFGDGKNTFEPLDPNYDKNKFAAGFLACNNVKLAKTPQECSPLPAIATNVARFLVLGAGTLLKLASDQNVNGAFRTAALAPKFQGDGQAYRLKFKDSRIDIKKITEKKPLIRDDLGNRTYAKGEVKMSGKLKVTGQKNHNPYTFWGYDLNPWNTKNVEALSAYVSDRKHIYVRPTRPDSHQITLEAQLANFTAKKIEPGQVEPLAYLVIREGNLRLKAKPIMGQDARESVDTFSIPTPIVHFPQIVVENLQGVMHANGMSVPISISEATLEAHNGFYGNQGNYVLGTMTLNGEALNLARQPLVPPWPKPYRQSQFNESYARTPHLKYILEHD